MNAKLLLFPVLVGTTLALDGCKGTDINDPMVRACRSDTTEVGGVLPNGKQVKGAATVVVQDDARFCRKAA